jgi:hypothetical protein
MKASRRPAKKSSAQETRPSKAAQAKSRRELEKFKNFANTTLLNLKRNRAMLVILEVVYNPHKPGGRIRSAIIKGPPWLTMEQ